MVIHRSFKESVVRAMKTMWSAVACSITLSGCFATMPTQGELLPVSSQRSAGVAQPGNAEILGSMGAALGAITVRQAPVAGAVLIGGAGYLTGRAMDDRARAVGSTTCQYRARMTGRDQNGSFEQVAEGSRTIPGYGTHCGK